MNGRTRWFTALPGKVGSSIACALLLLTGTAAAVEQRPLVLRHLTTADGLPQATVNTTLRDSQGFVWLGTEDGLVRFDGRQVVRYARSPDAPHSLPGNFIYQVVEDAQHDLWIAVRNAGIARWRRSTDRFDVYQNVPGDGNSLASNAVRTLLFDARGRLWIGSTDAGVDILDPATGKFEHRRHGDAVDSLSHDNVFTLMRDRAGDVWIGTYGGLDRWWHEEDRIARVGANAPHSVLRAQISQVVEGAEGTLWIGTYDAGLAQIDSTGRMLRQERHQPGKPNSLADNDVRALLRDAADNLWVGTVDGLDLLQPGARAFQRYQHDAGDASTLRDSYIKSLYQDSSGLVWIGTRSGGVSRWDPRSWEMGVSRPEWLREQLVTAFANASGRNVWIASLAGLFRYDTQTGVATPIDRVVGRANVLGDRRVMSLHEDSYGSLWIGTMTEGLKRLYPDNRLVSFPYEGGKSKFDKTRATSAVGIMSMAESRDGHIWLGTFNGGLNILDPITSRIRQLPYRSDNRGSDNQPGALTSPDVTAIVEDRHGNMWLGTGGGGLNVADSQGRVLRVFRSNPADPRGLPSDFIYSLTLDSEGRVWVGTDAGVARTQNPDAAVDAQQLVTVSLARGQSSDVAYGIVGDQQGGMWISGNAGLIRLDPKTGISRAYHREDGLQGEEFSFGAILRLRDGRLAFGGPGGFNILDPSRLSAIREPPALQLTRADVMGVPVEGAAPMWARSGLSLGYRANILSLDFSVLDFAAPEHSRLSYRLSGLTDRWIDVGAQRRITLTNLPAGDHLLEVRAASADSPWSATPLRFALHRDAAPWRTPWAYATYVLIIVLLITARVRHQRRKFREMQRARDHLESQVRERTIELVESNRQLEEAARAKSDFLDRMSHELRTPMNGVVGMTELLSRTTLSATQTHLTKTIRASAQILLQIVNDLLDLSKIRAGKVALEALPVDLGQVLEECTSLFAGAAETKGLELIVCPPANLQRSLRGDPLRMRQILMNLVGNAVKFTAQGEIVVRADVEQLDDTHAMVRLSVADTGIGIDPAVLAKIFEPFTQADEKTTRQFGGTGLGLSICRELADLMGGRISVESRQQIGSTFSLQLPMELGEELPAEAPAPVASARLYTRRPAFAESLQRHCAALGVKLAWDAAEQGATAAEDVLLIDASTQEPLLTRLLAQRDRAPLVAIATQSEVERLGLRLLLPERAVVLKPVHHVAVREALATVMHLPGLVAAAEPAQKREERLQGHVLLVEDDPVNAAVAEGYLAELGCSCVWVTSAESAIARRQIEHFDLVFMDLNMSDMDGFAATARIRERESAGSRVPIVALTAHDAHSYRERVLQAGMDDILSKPYSIKDCRAMLARWLPAKSQVRDGQGDAAELAGIDADAVRALGKLGSGTSGLYERLVGLFEKSSQPLMARLDMSLRTHDLKQAADVCHTLKSSAANVGAMAFSTSVRELEQLCLHGDVASATELHRRLAAAYEPLLATLRSTRMAASA